MSIRSAISALLLFSCWCLASPAVDAQPTRAGAVRSKPVDLGRVGGPKTVIANSAAVRRIEADERNVALRSDQYIVARWAARDVETTPTMAAKAKAWSIGFGFIGVTPNGDEIRFRPIIETSGGLLVSRDARRFKGLIYVGLRDNKDPAAAYPLPQPISLLVSGQADQLTPRQLTINHTNLPFAEVTVESQDPPDTVEFTLVANGTTERATVSLPVVRPQLVVSPARGRIQGLGLETSTVNVRAVGVANPAGRVVSLSSDLGSLEPSELTLNDQGTASAVMRSVSIGTATIRALSPPLKPAAEPIVFSWPITLVLASVFGGVAGAFLARLQKSGMPKTKSVPTVVVRGTITGVIVVALYAVGVNVLPIHPSANVGEVLAFAVAAAGGFLGLKI
jgi:hypothetical protein